MAKKFVSFLLIFVAGFCTLPKLSQAQPKHLIYLGEYRVKPGKVKEFESVIKDFVKEMKKYEMPYAFYMLSTRNFTYYSINGFDNYSSLDKFNADWAEVEKKIGIATMDRYHKIEFGAIDSFKGTLLKYRPNYSFIPEGFLLSEEDLGFVRLIFCSVVPSMKQEWSSVQLEWVDLFKRKKVKMPVISLTGDIGYEMPVWIYASAARGQKDHFDALGKMEEMLGKEGIALYGKNLPLIKRVDDIFCFFRHDLSYVPQNK